MKVYEIDDTEFKDMLIWRLYNGDGKRRLELHMTDLVYSMVNVFKQKLFPVSIEDIMLNRESHYKNVIRWMFGRGVDTGVSEVMQPNIGTWSQKNEVTFGGGIGHIDMYFDGIPYELKTSRYPFRKDLPWSHAIKQLSYYMAGNNEPKGKIKIFDMLPLDERTWVLELTKKDIKSRRRRIKRNYALLLKALSTGDWSKLPETKLGFIRNEEINNMDFLESNKSLVRRASKKWKREFEAIQLGKKKQRR